VAAALAVEPVRETIGGADGGGGISPAMLEGKRLGDTGGGGGTSPELLEIEEWGTAVDVVLG